MTTEENTPVQADALVEVTQADRDAAKALFNKMVSMGPIIDASDGRGLGREFLQAFARHRHAHQPTTDAEAEPVAWTGSGSLIALQDGREGFIWPACAKAHPIPLYAHPPADKARMAELEAALEQARQFIDTAAGEGLILNSVDAADLHGEIEEVLAGPITGPPSLPHYFGLQRVAFEGMLAVLDDICTRGVIVTDGEGESFASDKLTHFAATFGLDGDDFVESYATAIRNRSSKQGGEHEQG